MTNNPLLNVICPKCGTTERQGWLLLFDKMTDTKSEVGYLLQTGSSIFAIFIDGLFDHMNDNTNASLSVNSKEDDEDE
jgi:hypothetical protein